MKQIEIEETDLYYLVKYIAGIVYVQRKHPLAAIDGPLKAEEDIICDLCKMILAGE